ncbi:MAG: M50 family metallopeptidase [archaeon]
MPLISITEIVYIIVLTVVIGYIFSGYIKRTSVIDIKPRFKEIKLAIIIAAPGIILHELAHKFTALAFGLSAKFYIWFFGLILGLLLRVLNSPFLILAPGYVSIEGGTQSQLALVAFAGPFINLSLFLIAHFLLKKKNLKKKYLLPLYLTKMINLWLFIFNMLPVPPLDGYQVFYHLYKLIF